MMKINHWVPHLVMSKFNKLQSVEPLIFLSSAQPTIHFDSLTVLILRCHGDLSRDNYRLAFKKYDKSIERGGYFASRRPFGCKLYARKAVDYLSIFLWKSQRVSNYIYKEDSEFIILPAISENFMARRAVSVLVDCKFFLFFSFFVLPQSRPANQYDFAVFRTGIC